MRGDWTCPICQRPFYGDECNHIEDDIICAYEDALSDVNAEIVAREWADKVHAGEPRSRQWAEMSTGEQANVIKDALDVLAVLRASVIGSVP